MPFYKAKAGPAKPQKGTSFENGTSRCIRKLHITSPLYFFDLNITIDHGPNFRHESCFSRRFLREFGGLGARFPLFFISHWGCPALELA